VRPPFLIGDIGGGGRGTFRNWSCVSGIAGQTLIVNFPGSPRACAECFDAIAPALGHGIELLTSQPTEHP
jgi:hypothetical protein